MVPSSPAIFLRQIYNLASPSANTTRGIIRARTCWHHRHNLSHHHPAHHSYVQLFSSTRFLFQQFFRASKNMSTSISNKTDGNALGNTTDNDGKHSNGKQENNNHQTKTTAPPSSPPPGYQHIHEGQIHMMYPQSENSVFYNPVQVQNRDLSVFMLGLYAERRMERLWVTRRKKELRRELLAAEEEKNASEIKKESKSERKQRMERFERLLMDTLEKEKKEMDFNELVRQSSHEESAWKGDDANGNQEKEETKTSNYVKDDGMVVLDALAASGLRSLRYWKEVPGVRTVVVNDLDPVAIELARENVGRNGFMDDLVEVEGTNDKPINSSNNKDKSSVNNSLRPKGVHLQVGDATHEMYLSRLPPSLYPHQRNPTQLHYQKPQYDVIDLDPYGSAAPFLDSAVQAIRNGGLLAVTCTDMAALGGSHPETCYGRYGAMPLQRSGYLQELALRILLYHLSVVAGRYGRTIRPVLSVGMAFYVRVFVEVYDDKAGVNNLSLNHGLVFQSTQCSSFHVTPMASNEFVQHHQRQQNEDVTSPNINNKSKPRNIYKNGRGPHELGEPSCGETGAPYKIAGPCWIGPLHDMDIVQRAITRLEAAKDNDDIDPAGGTPLYPLHTATTLHGLLVSVSEELNDVPLYHVLPNVCSAVNTTTIPMTMFRAALANAGYRSSAYHKEPQAVKTDAPNHVVWDIVRAWCKEHPPSQKKESKRHRKGEAPGSTGKNGHMEDDNEEGEATKADVATMILSREIETKVDFTIPEGFGLKKKARRFAANPEANWGPKKAASGKNKRKLSDDCGDEMEKPGAKSSKQ